MGHVVKPEKIQHLEKYLTCILKEAYKDVKVNIFYKNGSILKMDVVSDQFGTRSRDNVMGVLNFLERKTPITYNQYNLTICPVTHKEFELRKGPDWEE